MVGFTPEELERFGKQTLVDRIGELVDVRLKKIIGFELQKRANGEFVMMPYGKIFACEGDLVNFMRSCKIDGNGHIMYRSYYLREASDNHIGIATRHGGESGMIKIELDAIAAIWFIGGSVIEHQG